jgi:DNA repair protein RadC
MPPRRLTLKEIPEEDRPREKLIRESEVSLSEAELLAILLGSGSRSESAVQLAQRILKESGGLSQLAQLSIVELCKFHGIGTAKASALKAAMELARRYHPDGSQSKRKLSSSESVFHEFKSKFAGKKQEEFWVIALNTKNRPTDRRMISQGTLSSSLVHPREVFRFAIRDSAASIIVLHNHPSGDPEPSTEDRKVTSILADAGKTLGIPLLDHVIIGNSSYFSFRDSGLL